MRQAYLIVSVILIGGIVLCTSESNHNIATNLAGCTILLSCVFGIYDNLRRK